MVKKDEVNQEPTASDNSIEETPPLTQSSVAESPVAAVVDKKPPKPTRITRMTMSGFKSFAKHTDILFGNQFNCVIGPNGAGKCIDGDSLVWLADGSQVKIRDIVNETLQRNSVPIDDGFIGYDHSLEILALDMQTLRITPRKVQAVVKKTSPSKMLKITTQSGREIIATPYHPLFIFDKNKIRAAKSEELSCGVRIAVPRAAHINIKTPVFYELLDAITPQDKLYAPAQKNYIYILRELKKIKSCTWKALAHDIQIPCESIKGLLDTQSINVAYLIKILRYAQKSDDEIIALIPQVKSANYPQCCLVPWKNSESFARLFGYLIAEGRLPPDNDHIRFTNADEEIVKDYVRCITEVFHLTPTINEYKPNCWDVIAYSKAAQIILSKFGMNIGGAADKFVSEIFHRHSTIPMIAEFLNGLYSGDGYVSDRTIELTTKSEKLAFAVHSMLTRMGITSICKNVVKIAVNSGFRGRYKNVIISGAENIRRFHEHVTFTHQEKQKRMHAYVAGNSLPNPNLDLIDANALVRQVVSDLNISVKKLRKTFPRLDAYCYDQCTPSRYGLDILVKQAFPHAQHTGTCESLQMLSLLTSADIYWDEIVSIQEMVPQDQWVFDLCVENDHNFIANNIIVHNSNVMDALCFVLGKSSSRDLRAEKAANLIYNGGKAKQPAKKGEVSIYFDNTEGTFPTPDKEIKITRIVKPSGQSLYKINDKVMTRTQIVDLLAYAKINPDGYNIVLQGDIVRLVEMRPDERRLLIEEISGISLYEEKKHKALLELSKVEERLKETEIVLAERNSYLKELKKDRDAALKYKEMNDKIRQNKASYLKIQIDARTAERNDYEQKSKKIAEELQGIKTKIERLKEENAAGRAKIAAIEKEIEEQGETEQLKLNKEIESFKIELTKMESRKETCKNEHEKIRARREELKAGMAETEEKIRQMTAQKEQSRKYIESKTVEIAHLQGRLKKIRGENQLENVADIEKQVEEIDKKSDELQKEITALREKQHGFIRERDSIQSEVKLADDRLNKIVDVEQEYKRQLSELEAKRTGFKKATLELNKALDTDSSIAAHLSNLRGQFGKVQEELAKLKARDVGRKETERADIAVTKILELREHKRGIFGTVAELGQVDATYTLALETAAGPRLKSIIVESDKVAAECIYYLKTKKLGTATFLPLNKISAREPSADVAKLAKAKGSYGIALDLIQFDPKFKKPFSYIFGETIVIENIDVATRLGVGAAKYVTLDGDVAETSGVMQGGFRLKKRGGMGFKEKDLGSDIEKLDEMSQTLQADISLEEKRRKENEELITKLRSQKAEFEGEIIKQEKSLSLETTDATALRAHKKELTGRTEQIDAQLREIANAVSKQNTELASLKIEKQKLRAKINALNNPTVIAEIYTYEQKIKEINDEVIRLQSDTAGIESQIATIFLPEKEKVGQILRQLDKDESQFTQEEKSLQTGIAEKQAALVTKEDAAKKFYARYKELFAQINALKESIQKKEFAIEKNVDESRQSEIRLNTLSLKMAELNAILSGLTADFAQYEGVPLDVSKTEAELKNEIGRFERMREDIGSVNMRALEIYEDVEKQYQELQGKRETLGKEKEDVVKLMNEIETKKKDLFMITYTAINENFQKFFASLSTKGASAHLVLENPEMPFEGGVRINVKITGSKFLDIRGLSGGEKTMTALAFIFAIQEYEPASFYVLDEVDAALDKSNAVRLGNLIKEYSKKAQYVIISHNDAVIATADILFGVAMNEDGISQVVSLKA